MARQILSICGCLESNAAPGALNVTLYLARHASADSLLTSTPYDVPPGPPLTAVGESEARLLGEFLRSKSIAKIYSSAFLRAQRTAAAIAACTGAPVATEAGIAEWHKDERARDVVARVVPVLDRVATESAQLGSICLVSHGGTIGVMLRKLGMPRETVDAYWQRFGGQTPLPPAGVWLATQRGQTAEWQLELVFTPERVSSRGN